MREKPADLDERDLIAALRTGWGIDVASVGYLPVGAGSHHWAAGPGWFVKVDTDDAGLRRSFAVASALDLDFVVAPVPTADGGLFTRLTPRYVVTVFPMIDGEPGEFGPHRPSDLPEMSRILTALHGATPAVADLAPRAGLGLPGRSDLLAALRDAGRPWTAGPYSEPARRVLARHTDRIAAWLAEFDQLADAVREKDLEWVVTHGEPHPGNVLRTAAGLRLIDWTTVRIAPRERDLWMLAHMLGAEPVDLGIPVDAAAIAFYRRGWVLADLAAFLAELRAPHTENADVSAALRYLTGYLEAT